MPVNVLVTGATGNVGSALVHALAAAGVRPRAFVRDAEKARTRLGDRAELVVGDLADAEAVRHALRDVDAVFLACGNVADQVALEQGAIDAARQARVGRVVKLSARGAAPDAAATYWRAHAAIEEHLVDSGLPAVLLRPSFLMTNLLAAAATVHAHGVLPAPAGAAAIAMVDPLDVAAVAARVLVDGSVPAQVLTLSGPEALTYRQVAERLGAVVGRHIRYVDVPPQAAAQQMVADGVPEIVAAQVLEVFARLRQGDDSRAGGTVPLVSGRPASTVDDFARRHAAAFGAQEVLA
jgi:uncharacterized protein YbjT (DUF2867 family)